MLLDDDTNVAVVTYKGAIPYSIYMNDGVFYRISSILAMNRYKPPILHEDRHSYYWKKTYTYGPWPPSSKKTAPKEKKPSMESFVPEYSVIPMEESPPRRNSPIQLSSPEASMETLGSYEYPRFIMREDIHEATIKEEKSEPWEPLCRL